MNNAISPHYSWRAKAYHFYKKMPTHRGKQRLLNILLNGLLQEPLPFAWTMKNGAVLSIPPSEGQIPHSVGWTCYECGVWEPHVENWLRQLLKPGDIAVDAGANIGYFSTAMAQSVGKSGLIYAFEPIPTTFEQLRTAIAANKFDNLTALPIALGAQNTTIEINYDPEFLGNASLYGRDYSQHQKVAAVEMRTLDTLIVDGVVKTPHLIKVDVEGHELDVLAGSKNLLQSAHPYIIFEYNTETAALAGWTLQDAVELILSCAHYSFYLIKRDGQIEAIDAANYFVENTYIDILASAVPVYIS